MVQTRTPRLRFATRVLLLQLAVVSAIVLMTAGTFAALTYQWLGDQAEQNALAVARTFASSDDVRRETAALAATPTVGLTPAALAGGPLQLSAVSAQARTDALFVVVTDDAGLRLAHPNPALLGQKVSTDPSTALAGGEETSQQQGTLGHSVRAKVPVFAPGSSSLVVGEVSVGFSSDSILTRMLANIVPLVLVAGISLVLGAVASIGMGRRLRRLTLGLEPEEISGLVQDQEAVLRGVDEGVIGLSNNATITVFNEGARRLLAPGTTRDYSGLALARSGLPGFLSAAAGSDGIAEYGPAEHVVGDRVVIVTARPVRLNNSPGAAALGRVIMVRDRTEVQALTRQLDAVTSLGTALRAQRHEFANRLHTVAGLLDIDRAAEAREYIGAIVSGGPLQFPVQDLGLLKDPYLEAFIGAKSIEAHERGVELRIGAETLIRGHITDPQDVTAVLGNLLDNAIRAAVAGTSPHRWVEVELLDEHSESGGTLHLVVADSGDGLVLNARNIGARHIGAAQDPAAQKTEAAAASAAATEQIFSSGYSTQSRDPSALDQATGHGVGLALVRHLARRRGGEVWVASPGSPDSSGAVFCARLPGVVALTTTPKEPS